MLLFRGGSGRLADRCSLKRSCCISLRQRPVTKKPFSCPHRVLLVRDQKSATFWNASRNGCNANDGALVGGSRIRTTLGRQGRLRIARTLSRMGTGPHIVLMPNAPPSRFLKAYTQANHKKITGYW
jgi:hypothetical protein